MKRLCVYACVMILCAVSAAEAGPLRMRGIMRRRSQPMMMRNQPMMMRNQAVIVSNQAAVFSAVPFAVPVAVPVATVVQPTYLYAYGAYAASAVPATAPVVAPPVANTIQIPEISSQDSEALDRRAVDALIRCCVSCHNGEGAGGELVIADEEGQLAAKLPRHRLLRAIEAGKMPPPEEAPPLEPSEIEAIRHWARLPRDLAY